MKNLFELFWVRLKSQWFFFTDFCKTVFKYYRNPSFAKADLQLIFGYMLRNPYKMSRDYLKAKGESDVYAYGETPLATLEEICEKCGITESDTVFELGCGRGRTCFWLNQWLGCRVVGIEFIPQFVEIADIVKNSSDLKGIEFRCEDFTESALGGATVVYLFGTCLKDEDIEKLTKKIDDLPSGTKIVSVSFPLTDYTDKLEIMRRFEGRFAWGGADVYFQIRK
jgi:SAM-dependent methyltransferase